MAQNAIIVKKLTATMADLFHALLAGGTRVGEDNLALCFFIIRRNRMNRFLFSGCLLLMSISAGAADYLSGSEVHSLFRDSVAIQPKGQQGMGSKFAEWNFEEGGKLIKYPAGGKRGKTGVQEGTWSVDGKGRLCFSVGGEKEKCRHVNKDGDQVKLFNKKGEEKETFSQVRGG